MNKESVNIHVNNYCRLRDKQYAVYTEYALSLIHISEPTRH